MIPNTMPETETPIHKLNLLFANFKKSINDIHLDNNFVNEVVQELNHIDFVTADDLKRIRNCNKAIEKLMNQKEYLKAGLSLVNLNRVISSTPITNFFDTVFNRKFHDPIQILCFLVNCIGRNTELELLNSFTKSVPDPIDQIVFCVDETLKIIPDLWHFHFIPTTVLTDFVIVCASRAISIKPDGILKIIQKFCDFLDTNVGWVNFSEDSPPPKFAYYIHNGLARISVGFVTRLYDTIIHDEGKLTSLLSAVEKIYLKHKLYDLENLVQNIEDHVKLMPIPQPLPGTPQTLFNIARQSVEDNYLEKDWVRYNLEHAYNYRIISDDILRTSRNVPDPCLSHSHFASMVRNSLLFKTLYIRRFVQNLSSFGFKIPKRSYICMDFSEENQNILKKIKLCII